jgi:NitT/TauT family transport system permease protein
MLRLLSFTVFLATWWGAALLAAGEKLPPPPAVMAAIVAEANSGALFFNLGVTLARVALAFTLAMTLGAAIGYVMGRIRLADRLGDPWLILLLNLPALVVIVLAYIWAGLTEVAAIAAVAINKLPIAVVMVREGTRVLDTALDEMTAVFAIPRWRAFRHVILPQLAASRPPRDPVFLWSGRSSWLPNCSDAQMALASRSASPSSCSTSLVCLPMR